jgi:hypothetical protein
MESCIAGWKPRQYVKVFESHSPRQKCLILIDLRAGSPPAARGRGTVASYRSPIGRLASLPVGADQEIRTPKGVRSFELIERAALHPALSGAEWDSINTVLQSLDFGPLTVVSLKELLRTVAPGDDIDLLDSLLAEGRAADNVLEGLRRSAIMKMGLRDQPLLDQYQDEIYGEVTDQRIRKVLDQPPPKGFARWNGPLIARALGDVDVQYVWRSLRKQKIDVAGRKSWCESNDPDFAAKAADVVGLYMAPPKNAIVLCVDEKPSIQALERAQGYLKLPNGRALTGHSHDYKRHGTTTLFAAFEVATGTVRAAHKKRRRRKEFLDSWMKSLRTIQRPV